MRFMMMIIPKDYENVAPDARPTAELMAEMMRYNEALAQAGVLLALDGLQPPASGTRLTFHGRKANVVDGPFAEAKEAIGGYWLIQAKSQEEAVEWARRCPAQDGDVIEVRRLQELSDFGPDVLPPALGERLAEMGFGQGRGPQR